MIENYFRILNDRRREMKKALKKYIEATEDFHSLTGIIYSDMPKSQRKYSGFDDLMANIETLFDKYMEKKKEYDLEHDKCLKVINKLDKEVHKLIIEYAYVDRKKDKEILAALKDFHNIDYSYGSLRNIKSEATKEFKVLLQVLTIHDNELHHITTLL